MATIITGIQPTGNGSPHLGNYFGAIKNIKKYINNSENKVYVMIADVHATTVPYNPKTLKEASKLTFASLVACGIPKENIFKQSMVPEQMELNSYLMNFATVGSMERMTQYKDKSNDNKSIGFGLLSYPILMAADIIAYNATHIPAGKDQHQHVQLTQELVRKLNNVFGYQILNEPSIIMEKGCKIMDLQYPEKKMSKSAANQNGVLYLSDDIEINIKKIKKAVTDSKPYIDGDFLEQSIGVKNIIELISLFSGKESIEVFNSLIGLRYSNLKELLIHEFKTNLETISTDINQIVSNEKYIKDSLIATSLKSRKEADYTLQLIKHNLGFGV